MPSTLTKRDSEWMGQVHEFLGLTVGVVLNSMDKEERRAAYNCDITYVTNNELGFIKQILECNGRQRLTLTFHLYMFLRLNRLMQTIRITASRHDTSGKFIYDQYFIILNHIILVTEHQVMRTECQDNVMLDFQVLRTERQVNEAL